MYQGILKHYQNKWFHEAPNTIVTLCEGNTPLIRATQLEKMLPGVNVYLKFEGLNPTGSFKDRGMTYAVSEALMSGAKAILCASTGNTSASAAAYAAKAGIKCFVIIPNGKIASGKLAQAIAYGAEILTIDGNFDDALKLVKDICEKEPIVMVNSLNPYRLLGQQSAAFEICDALKKAPTHVCLPVGNAGNVTAYGMGFQKYYDEGLIQRRPKLFGYQAALAAPIVDGHVVENPETVATAIRIGNPASWHRAIEAVNLSEGRFDKIPDEDIIKAHQMLSAKEGIFAEPASCISIAGLFKAFQEGHIKAGDEVVCVLTGNGLKDIDSVMGLPFLKTHSFEALKEKIKEALHD